MTTPNRLPARVIADHRVTIPEEFREEYDLEEGDRVWVTVEPIDPERTAKDLIGT